MLRTLLAALLLLPWPLLVVVPVAHATARNAVIIGDSQAEGLNHPLTRALEGYDIHVVGSSANRGKGLKWFLDNHTITNTISSNNPQVVILIIGGNDNVRTNGRTEGVSVDTYTQRLTTAYNQAAGSGRVVYWIGPATSRDSGVQTRHQATRTVQQSVLPGLGATWIDGMPGSADGPFQGDTNSSQRSHLTGEGYRRWACSLAAQIGGGPSTSCPTTADADMDFPPAVADSDTADEGTGTGAATTAPSCNPNGAGVLPVHLGVSIGGLSEVNGLGEYVNAFYRYLAGISLIVAIVMVVYGGFRYLVGATSGDIGRGKEIIRDALVGMVLVLSAYAILNTINPATVNLRTTVLTSIQCVELPAGAVARQCTDDSSCASGSHCVQVSTVWNPEANTDAGAATVGGATAGGIIGGIPGAIVGGLSGFIYGTFSHISSPVMQCTDGAAGSPCGNDTHCTGGGVCAEGFNTCIPATGNPVGAPCNENGNCQSGSCTGSSGARQCHGDVPILTQDALAGNRYVVPDNYACFQNGDCETEGGLCQGPFGGTRKFCIRRNADETPLGAPCFRTEFNIQPTNCVGAGDAPYTCMVCPSTGSRNWEAISNTNDPDKTHIGSCRTAADAGTPCSGSAH